MTGTDNNVGGFAGWSNGNISNTYFIGKISGNTYNIGLLAGGLKGKVSNSYSISGIRVANTKDNVGGLVGKNDGDVDKSYYNKEASSGGCGEGRTIEEMKQKKTFNGWNFDEIWFMNNAINDGYPYLHGH